MLNRRPPDPPCDSAASHARRPRQPLPLDARGGSTAIANFDPTRPALLLLPSACLAGRRPRPPRHETPDRDRRPRVEDDRRHRPLPAPQDRRIGRGQRSRFWDREARIGRGPRSRRTSRTGRRLLDDPGTSPRPRRGPVETWRSSHDHRTRPDIAEDDTRPRRRRPMGHAVSGRPRRGSDAHPQGAESPHGRRDRDPGSTQTPEQLCGLVARRAPRSQRFPLRLARSGCRVIVPLLIDRETDNNQIPHREFALPANVRAGPARDRVRDRRRSSPRSTGSATTRGASGTSNGRSVLIGYGDGGMLAFYAAAVQVSGEDRLRARQRLLRRPLEDLDRAARSQRLRPAGTVRRRRGRRDDRARSLIIEAAKAPDVDVPARQKAAPGPYRVSRTREAVQAEAAEGGHVASRISPGELPCRRLGQRRRPRPVRLARGHRHVPDGLSPARPEGRGHRCRSRRKPPRSTPRLAAERQRDEIETEERRILEDSADTSGRSTSRRSSTRPRSQAFKSTIEPYRKKFDEDVIGKFDDALLPLNARSRKVFDEPKYTGYEVDARRLPRRVRLRHPARAQGHQAGREAARGRLPARAGRTAERRGRSEGRTTRPTTSSRSGWPSGASSPSRRRTRTSSRTASARSSARPTRWARRSSRSSCRSTADRRLAEVARLRRPRPDRLLRPAATAARRPCASRRWSTDYCLSICSADFNEWVWKNASITQPVQLRLDRRVRDLRVRPRQHVQLRRDGRPDRAPAVHGRARPLRRRRRPTRWVAYEYAKVRLLYDA